MTDLQIKMVEDLVDVESGLTPWELDFVESMSHWSIEDSLSGKQAEILERIYEERV